MTIQTEVAAVLAEIRKDTSIMPGKYWADRLESALTAKAEAVEPVAWLVTREGDPTFPKAYIREDYADLWTERNDLPPFIEKTPLYAHAPPAVPVASVPDGWREDVSLAAQMLKWGREEGLDSKQIDAIDAHAEKLFAMLATPPTNQEGAAP